MQQIIDPRQGNQRQKSLLKNIAAKAMARKGYKSKVGIFGKLATSGVRNRSLRPNKGPGSGVRVAKAGGFGSIFDGLDRGPHTRAVGQGVGGYVNTAPLAAAAPSALPAWGEPDVVQEATDPWVPVEDAVPGEGGWAAYTGPEGPGAQPGTPEYGQTPPDVPTNAWVPATGDRKSGYNQNSSSGQILAPGGLIPLGGGVYYDLATGEIHGGAGAPGGSTGGGAGNRYNQAI